MLTEKLSCDNIGVYYITRRKAEREKIMETEKKVWNSETLDRRLVDSYTHWDLSELTSSQIESEMDYLASERHLDDRKWSFDWCKLDIDITLDVSKLAEQWGEIICGILDKNPKGVKIKCVGGFSPKEYNCLTDSFDFTFESLGDFSTEDEAIHYLKQLSRELLTDDSLDMFWEANEAIGEWVRENTKNWTWDGVEYDSVYDLADDLDRCQRLLDDGAEYTELPRPMKKELAGRLLDEKLMETESRSASWEELANPWEYIEESVVEEHYSGISFGADDFRA